MQKSPNVSVQYLTIDEEIAGQRIDNFLITYLKTLPKTRIYRILRKGEVRVNKKRVQAAYRIQVGDKLRLPPMHLEEKASPTQPGKRSIALLTDKVLYEDKNLMIINKPSGIPVHGGTRTSMGVIEILRTMYPKIPHLELAHRLDADTSGCLILAKKRGILKELHELMRSGQIQKTYLALTQGCWKDSELRVNLPLKKNYLSNGERIVRVDEEGKVSLTVFTPIQDYNKAMLVEARLHTGRTHQIRVHASHLGHAIACDEKYGDKNFNKFMRQLGLNRLFLHAYCLEFDLPSTGDHIKVTAPLEMALQDCLRALENDH